ncbi:MAG TPA: HAMP domain-containing histidine kinase [Thermoplasmatales archaeon]|nr:HAMP domain-containing histidine kinase [Thermoplasmatales archaeon]
MIKLSLSSKIYISLLFSGLTPMIITSLLLIPLVGNNMNTRLMYNISAIIITTILSTILIARFLSLHITEPIDTLVKSVKKMEEGKFEPVQISTGDDLDILRDAFNSMGKEITKVIKNLKELDEAKTQFLSVTSHELRTPMTPIKAQLQLLLKEHLGRLTDRQKKSLEMIERNTERLDRLLQELLTISRIQSGRLKLIPKKQSIQEVIRETVSFMKPFASKKNITIKEETEDVPDIEFDRDKITEVVQNLISNAVKFTPEGGKITVSLKKYGNGVIVSVQDTGIGLSEEDCKNVFKPFFQADIWRSRQVGGAGLGLAICKGIVEAHGGKIWCQGRPDKGSMFSFSLPPKIGEKIELSQEEIVAERVEDFFTE